MSEINKVKKQGEKYFIQYKRTIKDVNDNDVEIPYKAFLKTVEDIELEISELNKNIDNVNRKILELEDEKKEIKKVK